MVEGYKEYEGWTTEVASRLQILKHEDGRWAAMLLDYGLTAHGYSPGHALVELWGVYETINAIYRGLGIPTKPSERGRAR